MVLTLNYAAMVKLSVSAGGGVNKHLPLTSVT